MNYEFRNKEWLVEQINKYGYIKKISRETGYAETSIRRWIDKYDLQYLLKKPTKEDLAKKQDYEKFPYKNKQWLIEQVEKHRTVKNICLATGCAPTSIRRYLEFFKIKPEQAPIYRKFNINEDYFETIDTEHKAYWLGFLMADGNVTDANKKYCIRLTLKKEDDYLPKLLLRDIESNTSVSYDKYNRCTARVFCKKMFYDLGALNIQPRKTGHEKLPKIPDELFKHFVRGFFDGDGTIYKRKNRKRHKCTIGAVCQNKEFLIELNKKIFEQCGADFGLIYKHPNNAYECKTECFEKCKKLMEWIYKDATIAMIRKYERAKEYLNITCPSLERFKEEFE